LLDKEQCQCTTNYCTIETGISHEDNFKQALISSVMAGGDSVSSSMVVSMVLAAYHGIDGIPKE